MTLDAFFTCTLHAASPNHFTFPDLIIPITLRLSHLGYSGDKIKDKIGQGGIHKGSSTET
jgi:hypothetical protein